MRFRIVAPAVLLVFLFALAFTPAFSVFASAPQNSDPATCTVIPSIGMNASIVATTGETISGMNINAAPCDIGIYVGPGVSHVTITGNYITGANDHGILVENAMFTTISHNTVTGNQLHPAPDCTPGVVPPPTGCIAENKAVQLIGSSHSMIIGNNISFNMGSPGGGIGISDNGAFDPGVPFPHPGTASPADYNTIADNLVMFNLADCQIVVSAYNPGEGVSHNTVEANTINVGVTGIVVAADSPNTTATYNRVMNNYIANEFIPGIIIHSNTPGDVVSHNSIIGNTLSNNGADPEVQGPGDMTGIILIGAVEPVTFSIVIHNHIMNENSSLSGQGYGIWSCNTLMSPMHANSFINLTTPIHTQAAC